MGPLTKWIVSGSAEKREAAHSMRTVRIIVRATHFNVEVSALSAGQAHDLVVASLDEAGWDNINLSGINQEV